MSEFNNQQSNGVTHTHNGALLARYAYTLDATGNRTRVTETVGGVTRGISYTYDWLYRLTAADYSTGEQYAYQYDSVGNRVVMTDAIGIHTYVYDAANRLTSIQLPDSSIQEYTWDKRGNLLADGTFTYTYNAAGRMVQAQNLTATLVYTYNADGLRVAQVQSVSSVQSVDTFTWDWATGIPELLSDGESLYLSGYDTLGWQTGADWTFVARRARQCAAGDGRHGRGDGGARVVAVWRGGGYSADGVGVYRRVVRYWCGVAVSQSQVVRWYDGTVYYSGCVGRGLRSPTIVEWLGLCGREPRAPG